MKMSGLSSLGGGDVHQSRLNAGAARGDVLRPAGVDLGRLILLAVADLNPPDGRAPG
jgi:hypothetical protein